MLLIVPIYERLAVYPLEIVSYNKITSEVPTDGIDAMRGWRFRVVQHVTKPQREAIRVDFEMPNTTNPGGLRDITVGT
jgi:hypothetical protein